MRLPSTPCTGAPATSRLRSTCVVLLSCLAAQSAGCTGAGPAPVTEPHARASSSAAPAASSFSVPPPVVQASGPPSALSATPSAPAAPGPLRVPFALQEGGAPCTLVFEARSVKERETSFFLADISRIAVEDGGACSASTLFDVEAERRVAPGKFLDTLEGGLLPKLGHVQEFSGTPENPGASMLLDMNFDGFLDLRVIVATGAYNVGLRNWLFDPASRKFVPAEALDRLIWPLFDASTRTIKAGGRVMGASYESGEHQWINGKLETLWQTSTTVGEMPDGRPLPAGYESYEVRYKRAGGALRKVFQGPVRAKKP
jgi:hypothetical protein